MLIKSKTGTMEFTNEVTDILLCEMEDFLADYRERVGVDVIWKSPLIAYANVSHPYICDLRTLISPTHYIPEEILQGATVILSYFIPFQEHVGKGNVGGVVPSPLWSQAYNDTNKMFPCMNAHLRQVIESMGYHAASPENVGTLGKEQLYSNWSQRHIAYAAGLGTFGMNNMLITKQGCCGRYFSLVTDLPVLAGVPQKQENCLYKREKKCGLCMRQCPAGALSKTGVFNRQLCNAHLGENMNVHGMNGCGKCVVGMPCTFTGDL